MTIYSAQYHREQANLQLTTADRLESSDPDGARTRVAMAQTHAGLAVAAELNHLSDLVQGLGQIIQG